LSKIIPVSRQQQIGKYRIEHKLEGSFEYANFAVAIDEILLLIVHLSAEADAGLECALKTVPIDGDPRFEALWYA